MKIQPLHDRVLVEIQKPEEKVGEIMLPDTAQDKKNVFGSVIAIGIDEDLPVEVGDRVVVQEWAGEAIEFEGKKYRIYKLEFILAIIKE